MPMLNVSKFNLNNQIVYVKIWLLVGNSRLDGKKGTGIVFCYMEISVKSLIQCLSQMMLDNAVNLKPSSFFLLSSKI